MPSLYEVRFTQSAADFLFMPSLAGKLDLPPLQRRQVGQGTVGHQFLPAVGQNLSGLPLKEEVPVAIVPHEHEVG